VTDAINGGRQLYYEIMWERDASLGEHIQQAWRGENAQGDLRHIGVVLKNVLKSLKMWSREKFGSVRQEIEEKRKDLAELQAADVDRNAIREAIREMNELLYREEMLWLQRARVDWLREGDRNTKFFHQKATWRARKNRIRKLKEASGVWVEDQARMKEMVNEYFQELYPKDPQVSPVQVSDLFEQRITVEMNESLCKAFTDDEIGTALFQIGPLKAPGPDGFPARFFQRNWATLKEDVIKAVKLFFGERRMLDGVNDTAIVLIPKVQNPETLKDYRPISLCNVIYKVVCPSVW
jgi:hypothetical protein